MGNVSHIMPAIHPSFTIDTKFGNHHPGFTEFSGKPHNMAVARMAGKAMAGATIDLFETEGLVAQAREEFEAMRTRAIMWEPNYVR